MQKGEGLHRRCRIGGYSLAVVCFALCFPTLGRAHPEPESAAWISARGGAVFPSESIDIRRSLREKTFFGFISSLSNPFGIDDLVTSGARVGFHSPAAALWAGWALVHHPLYREDIFSLELGARFVGRRLLVKLRPAMRRRRIAGHTAFLSREMCVSASLRCPGGFDIGFAAALGDRDPWRVPDAIAMISLRLGALALVANHLSSDRTRRETRFGVEMALGRRASLLAGYRTGVDEMSAGLSMSVHDFLIGISVNSHAVLERTYSLSIGRMWER